jgi:hypothetical protein
VFVFLQSYHFKEYTAASFVRLPVPFSPVIRAFNWAKIGQFYSNDGQKNTVYIAENPTRQWDIAHWVARASKQNGDKRAITTRTL